MSTDGGLPGPVSCDELGLALMFSMCSAPTPRKRAPPSRAPFVDLTHFIGDGELEALDEYLLGHGICNTSASGEFARMGGDVGIFSAESRKYGDAIELCDRDTSSWSATSLSFSSDGDFKACRAHRGDPFTWQPNLNARLLPGVVDFVRNLPFFERTGKIAIILNAPNDAGVEHVDHRLDDLVSEFVWVRTGSSAKRFYVRDPKSGEVHFVHSSAAGGESRDDSSSDSSDNDEPSPSPSAGAACVCWFDDHLEHCLAPVDSSAQWSIRIDGRFTPEFREHICREGTFGAQRVPTKRGLRGVLASQQTGPTFLQAIDEEALVDLLSLEGRPDPRRREQVQN